MQKGKGFMKLYLFLSVLSLSIGVIQAQTLKDEEDEWLSFYEEETNYDVTQGENYKRLEGIINGLKKRFEVPASFSCEYLEWSGSERWGVDEWVVAWTNPKAEEYSGEIRITFTEKGQVIQYFTNYYDSEKEGKIKLTQQQAYDKALQYLKEKGGYDLKALKYIDKEQPEEDVKYFAFQYYKDGLPVYDEKVSVGIYTTSGRVVLMNGISPFVGEYKPLGDLLSIEEARVAFVNKMPLEKMYWLSKDESGVYQQVLVYHLENPYKYGIQGIDGSIVMPKFEREYWSDEAGNLKNPMDSLLSSQVGPFLEEDLKLDEAALKKYIKDNHLLTPEEAQSVAAKSFPLINNAFILEKQLTKGEGKTYWNLKLMAYTEAYKGNVESLKKEYETKKLDYRYINVLDVVCEAATGEVMVYDNTNLPRENIQSDSKPTEKQLQEVEALLKKLNSKEWEKAELRSTHGTVGNYSYLQLINGIPVPYYGFSLTYNHEEKEIAYYTKHLYKGKVISASDPLTREELAIMLDLKLYYLIVSKQEAVPVYMYLEPKTNFEMEKVETNSIESE